MFFPPLEKSPLVDSPKTNFLFLPMKCQFIIPSHNITQFHPLTKQQSSSYNPIKTTFLAVVIVPARVLL